MFSYASRVLPLNTRNEGVCSPPSSPRQHFSLFLSADALAVPLSKHFYSTFSSYLQETQTFKSDLPLPCSTECPFIPCKTSLPFPRGLFVGPSGWVAVFPCDPASIRAYEDSPGPPLSPCFLPPSSSAVRLVGRPSFFPSVFTAILESSFPTYPLPLWGFPRYFYPSSSTSVHVFS